MSTRQTMVRQGFWAMMVVHNGSSQHVDHEIGGTSVVGILYQENALELISDHLNDGPTVQE